MRMTTDAYPRSFEALLSVPHVIGNMWQNTGGGSRKLEPPSYGAPAPAKMLEDR